jgi:anthranilate phosphoribosyltransferase
MDTYLSQDLTLLDILKKLFEKNNLSSAEVYYSLNQFENDPNPIDLTAFLILLKAKGETGEELAGMVKFLTEKMHKVPVGIPTLDVVGTGGDGSHTVNISTGSAIVAAACGVPIAKHGNRSVSSKCGSADFIESLGIPIEITPEQARDSIKKIHIAFLYAPIFNPFIKLFQPVRTRLKLRTIFNLLGPLLNPAQAQFRIVGVYENKLMEPMADALQRIGVLRGLVCHGHGLDELSTLGPSEAILINQESKLNIHIDPKKYGFDYSTIEELRGGNAEENCTRFKTALETGKGAIADTLALNAGVAVWLYGDEPTIGQGIEKAKWYLRSGKAFLKLREWVKYAQTNPQA